MFRKNYFTFLLSIALFLAGSIAAFAQTATVTGKVEVKKADGTTAPVAGALVEVFRANSKAKFPTDKTSKKGEFAFVGLPVGEKYILSVSGPGIAPIIYPNVPASAENVNITVSEGDGKRFTEEEVKQAVASGTTNTTDGTTKNTELTAEEKKAQEEQLKKIAEIESKNKSIESKNAIRQAALKEASDAFEAKNYDLAIAKFEEGYQADTTFIGSAPVFLTEKAKVLSVRAVDKYNKSLKITDTTAKIEAINSIIKDFGASIDTYNTSWTMLKNAPAASIPDPKNYEINKSETLNQFQNTVGYIVATEKVDSSKIEIIKNLTADYLSVETDAAKKLKAQISLADVYRIAGDSDNAVIAYKKALEMSPDNPDATAGLGLSLFNAGVINNNVAQQQEGFGYMERFSQIAPDNHRLKSSVAEAVVYLKSQKITPQKVNTPKKKN